MDDELDRLRKRRMDELMDSILGQRQSPEGGPAPASDDGHGDPILHGTDETFPELIAEGVVVVDAFATWCGPCHAFAPTFASAAAEFKDRARFVKLDVDAHPRTSQALAVQSIPTLFLFRDGKPISRVSGSLAPKAFRAWLAKHADML